MQITIAPSDIYSTTAEADLQRNVIAPISDGLALDATARLAAWLEAMRVGAAEIDLRVGMPSGYALSMRMNMDYREMVRRCIAFFAKRQVENARGDYERLFDEQIEASARALIEVRDNPYSKGGDRVKAASEFLDRAPKAPKATKQVDERKTIITIPMRELKNMQRALIEEGSEENVEVARLLDVTRSAIESGMEEGYGAQGSVEVEVV